MKWIHHISFHMLVHMYRSTKFWHTHRKCSVVLTEVKIVDLLRILLSVNKVGSSAIKTISAATVVQERALKQLCSLRRAKQSLYKLQNVCTLPRMQWDCTLKLHYFLCLVMCLLIKCPCRIRFPKSNKCIVGFTLSQLGSVCSETSDQHKIVNAMTVDHKSM